MPDLSGCVTFLALLYGAGLVGALVALLTRATNHRARLPTLLEAGWCVFLPPFACLVLPLLALVDPHLLPAFRSVHQFWHAVEAAIHASSLLHGVLHGANGVVLVAGLYFLGRTVYVFSQMRTFQGTLRRSTPVAEYAVTGEAFYCLSSPRPLCFTGGSLHPVVFLTTGLREQLSERELTAVLAHEAAHVRRRDPLLGTGLTLFYTLLPLPGSGRLLRDWQAAVERFCDQEAARQIGSPHDVASALVHVARLVARQPEKLPHGACFTEAAVDVEDRVTTLLQVSSASCGKRWPAAARAVGGLALLLSAASWLSHAVALFAQH
jgi:Zn-dependent protease with chaperone function